MITLKNNFQLAKEIMALAIVQGISPGANLRDGQGKTMTVDCVTALLEEAMGVLCCQEKLAPSMLSY